MRTATRSTRPPLPLPNGNSWGNGGAALRYTFR